MAYTMYLHVPDITIHSVRKISVGPLRIGSPRTAGVYLVNMGEHWPNIPQKSPTKIPMPPWSRWPGLDDSNGKIYGFFVDEDWCFSALQRAFGFKGAFGICVEHIWNVFRIWRSPTNWDIQLFWDDNNHCEESQFWIVLEAHACASIV